MQLAKRFAATILGGALLLLGLAMPAKAQTRWVMATPYAENFHTLNIRQFVADVEKATEGRLAIQLHANASLLPMAQIKRGVQTGRWTTYDAKGNVYKVMTTTARTPA